MNESTQLQLAYSFNNISYVNGESVGLYDYTTRGVSVQLTKSLDRVNQVFISSAYSIFNVPSTTLETKSVVYHMGVDRNFSETLHGSFSTGLRRTLNEQDELVCTVYLGTFCAQTASETQATKRSSSVYNLSLEKKYEVTRITLSVDRSYDPSGRGGIVRTDSENLVVSRKFTARLSGNMTASNYNYTPDTGDLVGVRRHYYMIRPGLDWAWTNELNVNLSYQYSHIKRADDNQPASSNAVYLTFNYRWHKMAISR
jgi:hypothetical protein